MWLREFLWLGFGAVMFVGGFALLWYGLLKRGANNDEPQYHWPVVPYVISALFDPGHALLYGTIGVAMGGIVVVFWFLDRFQVL